MDPENHTPLDDAALGALYASTRDTLHTPVVDDAIEKNILATARAAPRRRLQTVPWASAAVVVLALGVAWQVARVERSERAAPAPLEQPQAREAIAAHRQAQPPPAAASPAATSPAIGSGVAPVADKPRAVARRSDDAEISAQSARTDSVGIAAADAPAAARVSEATVAADPRLDRVRSLLRQGKREEARAALATLRARETDLVLDAELDALLAAPAQPN